MITKYRTYYSKENILKLEVLRETDKCVFLRASGSRNNGERRENKTSKYWRYFDTWNDAHTYLIGIANKRVSAAETRFQSEMKKRDKIEKLTE